VEELLIQAARAAVLLIEAAAVLVVTFGSLEALFKLLLVMARPSASHGMRKAIWRRFGVWHVSELLRGARLGERRECRGACAEHCAFNGTNT